MANQQQDEWVQRVFGVTLQGVGVGAEAAVQDDESDDDEPVDDGDLEEIWSYARQAYQDASDEVDGQISLLQRALRNSDDLDLEEVADKGLNGITGNNKVPLMAAIRDIGSGSREAIARGGPKLRKAVQAFRAHLDSDDRIEACDNNPFGVNVAIRDTFAQALDQLEAAVGRA